VSRPFTTFNFNVSIVLDDRGGDPLCDAAFSEVSGLEVTHEVTTIREGGNNLRPVHLRGPVAYGALSLKRGMTASFDLWDWMDEVTRDETAHLTATCEVEMLAADRSGPVATFVLAGCVPTKLTAPALDAVSGLVAIEELEIAYDLLTLERPEGGEDVA
jgi:phage tail-like protein